MAARWWKFVAIKSASIEGLDELIEAFMKLPEEALAYVREGSNSAAQAVCNKAKQLVPIDTGDTQKLLYVRKATASKKAKYKVLSIIAAKKGAAAIGPLELGHKLVYFGKPTDRHIEARPFLRPAADENKENVVSTIADSMNKALEQMGGLK
jgi:HK97 gp10 family phage protein